MLKLKYIKNALTSSDCAFSDDSPISRARPFVSNLKLSVLHAKF